MIITCSQSGVINSLHNSLSIITELNERSATLVFQTMAPLESNEEIEVQKDDTTTIFKGIIERVQFDNRTGYYTVRCSSLLKLFDMKLVARTFENMTAQEIVEEIIDDYCAGFTHTNVSGSINIESAKFNYDKPSDCIRQIAESIGYNWHIDFNKDVHFYEKTTIASPLVIVEGADFSNLKIEPDTRELANVIVVRGGSYLSSVQTYIEVADGEKTKFVLPESPKDVAVYVSTGGAYIAKTIEPQFGTSTPTAEFQVNFNEKYIQNGTHSTLSNGHKIKVEYKFDVPLRLLKKDTTSIDALKVLFPSTDGEFYKVVDDSGINSRELAESVADENLLLYGNAKINGSFNTFTGGIEVGQIVTINYKGYNTSAVITSVTATSKANDFFIYAIRFSTVLSRFEDFLKELLRRSKIELNENDVVEIINAVNDTITVNDTVFISTDQNRQIDTVTVDDDVYIAKNVNIDYVLGPYFPSSYTDTKRLFILNASKLG